jgi:PAS domain S-box-containing protein
LRINERLAEINGIPAADHIGKTIRKLMPELADAVEPEMRRILETGEPKLDIEIVSETPAHPGEKRTWMEQWLPFKDSKGQVTGLSVVVEEVTERKQAEAALQQLNETLEQRVSERTSELAHTVEVLQGEIEQRLRVENELKLANEQMSQRADQLRRLAGELTAVEQTERKRLSKIIFVQNRFSKKQIG